MARRFTESYCNHPPGVNDHELVVVVNGGGEITTRQRRLFDPLSPAFTSHDNAGRDLGAFFKAADTIDADLMVFLGAPVRPRMDGWLDWIVQCYLANGPGFYGQCAFRHPSTHIRTTAFWCSPDLLLKYPFEVSAGTRYAVEHGESSLTLWAQREGFGVWQVTRKGVFAMNDWYYVPESEILFLDQHGEGMGFK
jgi:hypothetical protein